MGDDYRTVKVAAVQAASGVPRSRGIGREGLPPRSARRATTARA